jgi:oxidation protein CepF
MRPPAAAGGGQRQPGRPGNLLHYDPPEHTRLRKMLTAEFTMHRMRRLEPRMHALVTERLDIMQRAGPPADLIQQFAQPAAALMLCELLGVPRDDSADLARRSGVHHNSNHRGGQRAAAGTALTRYMTALVARERSQPSEELLGMLVRAHGPGLSDQELVGISTSLMVAGLDNTASLLGLGVLLLLEHPAQFALLREQPGLAGQALEEMLRYASVIQTASPRVALDEISVAGQLIQPGEEVFCSLLAANRDTALLLRDPDRFDISREPAAHVAFGHGVHYCLGAPLARMVLRIAYPALLGRFPGLRLVGPASDIRFRAARSRVYGVEALPVTW